MSRSRSSTRNCAPEYGRSRATRSRNSTAVGDAESRDRVEHRDGDIRVRLWRTVMTSKDEDLFEGLERSRVGDSRQPIEVEVTGPLAGP